jgi:hypothetical protein
MRFIDCMFELTKATASSKYPVAVTRNVQQVRRGCSLHVFYDIGCKFCGTFRREEAARIKEESVDGATINTLSLPLDATCDISWSPGVWHGYAHDAPCQVRSKPEQSALAADYVGWLIQLEFHPRNLLGLGLTDGEETERFWDYGNKCSPSTRIASRYGRHQRWDAQVESNNEEKAYNIGQ